MPKHKQFRNPDDLAQQLAGKHPNCRRVLGLDLGTNCGVAWMDINTKSKERPPMVAGQLSLDVGPWDTGPLRHIRLKQFLSVLSPDLIGFEDVKYTPQSEGLKGKPIGMIVARVATASELIGGFKVTMATWAEEHGVPTQGIAIGSIKKHATGKGNANKIDMIEAANEKFGVSLDTDDYQTSGTDNIADAMHIADMMYHEYLEGLK